MSALQDGAGIKQEPEPPQELAPAAGGAAGQVASLPVATSTAHPTAQVRRTPAHPTAEVSELTGGWGILQDYQMQWRSAPAVVC